MNRLNLVALVAALAISSSAGAATLTITQSGSGTYNVGDTITLTVTGDSQGASDLAVQGQLNFDTPGITNLSAALVPTQNTLLALGSVPWTVGVTQCNTSSCLMFNQLSAFGLSPAPASNLLTATVSFMAAAPGTSNVNWETNAATGFQLIFFGLTNATGTSITVIPEPTTAALLGVGLFGLAFAGRRRV